MPGPEDLDAARLRAVQQLVEVVPVADELATRLAARGHELALVGGSVRDALLGRLGSDLDFATDARPDEVLAAANGWAEHTWTTGIDFGTVGLARGGLRLEVTTYRAEAYDPQSRKPAVRYGDSLEDDLGRRDFTVNAMAVPLPFDVRRPLVDPHGGLVDLAARILRTPGRPEDSFGDDPLRMLRATRFAAQLGFTVDPLTLEAVRAMAERLSIVSAERVREELVKLVLADRPRPGLQLLVGAGLADVVIPELPRMVATVDEHKRHKDVWEHSLTVLEQSIELERRTGREPDLVLRLAALLHDIGKPDTRRFEPDGGVSFHHHEVRGAKLTRARLAALRFPKQVVDDVTGLVSLHLRFHGYGEGEWTDSAVRRYVRDAGPLLDRLHLLTRSDCTTRNRRKAERLARAYDDLEQRIAQLAEAEELAALRPDIDGRGVMEILGVPPGPIVGRALEHLLELRIERGPLGEDAAADELRRWAAAQGMTTPE